MAEGRPKCELCGHRGADVAYDEKVGKTICRSTTDCNRRQRSQR